MEKGAEKIAEVSKMKMGKTESLWAFPILDQEGLLRSLKRKWPVEQKKTIMRRQVSIRSPLSAKSKMKNPLIRSVYEVEEQDKSNSNVSNEEKNNNYPLWRYVKIIEKVEKKGGDVRWQCNYCNKIYFGSYSRVVAHLLKIKGQGVAACNTVTPQHKFDMEKLHKEANDSKNLRSGATNVPLPPSICTSGITTLPMGNVFDTKKRKGGASALEQAFNNEAREQLNFEIARMYPSPCFLDGKCGCVEPCVASGANGNSAVKITSKQVLSRDQREHIRFTNVRRKKDFACFERIITNVRRKNDSTCFERINTKPVNILDGLELHTGVFSAVEQQSIVDYVYELEELGKKGKLKAHTFTAPQKWMRGKGRVTIQFGGCYNYARDKKGNPPGILQEELVDKIPHLFKAIIRQLVRWHVLPTTCVPDSCIVNIYDKDDCIPPHIDNHDFLRPFCTVSFLSECDIVFGTNLKITGPGEFAGSFAIPLPVGSVLVLNGNGADVAKHCVPAVPTKRISITFRKMDESKWPVGFTPEPDLQGIQPLVYEVDGSKCSNISKINRPVIVQATRSENNRDISKERGLLGTGPSKEIGLLGTGPAKERGLFGTGPRTEGPLNRR